MISRFYSFLQVNSRPLAAIALSLYGMYLRCTMYAQRGLYPDELNQLGYTAGSGLLPFWKMYTRGEITAFPGDYLLTVLFVKLFGTNKWLITIPHIIATIIGFYLLYMVCSRYIQTLLGLTIAFLMFCLNFNLKYHAFEFRPYAVLPTLALAVFLLSERVVCQHRIMALWQRLLAGFFFFLAVGFHAYGILMVALFMLFFILKESQDRSFFRVIQNILPFSLILALFTVPLFVWYYIQNPIEYGDNYSRAIDTFQFIPNPLNTLDGFLRSLFGNLIGMKKLYPLLIGAIMAFAIPNKNKMNQLMFIALLIIVPIELILLTDLQTGYWFLQRQFVWVMPFFAIWLAWCWDSIFIYLTHTSWIKNITASRKRNSG